MSHDLNSLTDEELGRMIRHAAQGRESQMMESTRTKNSLISFFQSIGLTFVSEMLKSAAKATWDAIVNIIGSIFHNDN